MSYTRFEWDEAKNRRNTRKHGLSFSNAASMFEHPHLVHVDTRVSVVAEQFVRLLLHCGMPATDLDWIHAEGPRVEIGRAHV